MRAAAEAEHGGQVVHDLGQAQRAGEDPELEHAAAEHLLEIHHPAAAEHRGGALGLERGIRDDGAHVLRDIRAQGVGVAVQVAASARLAVEAHGVPLRDVGQLAHELADLAGVARTDDGLDAHGDMQPAGFIDRAADLVYPPHEVAQVDQALFPLEDGRDEFAGHFLAAAADGAVAIGAPGQPIELRRGDNARGCFGKAQPDGEPMVIAADLHVGRAGQLGFDFYSEGDIGGFGVRGFGEPCHGQNRPAVPRGVPSV